MGKGFVQGQFVNNSQVLFRKAAGLGPTFSQSPPRGKKPGNLPREKTAPIFWKGKERTEESGEKKFF